MSRSLPARHYSTTSDEVGVSLAAPAAPPSASAPLLPPEAALATLLVAAGSAHHAPGSEGSVCTHSGTCTPAKLFPYCVLSVTYYFVMMIRPSSSDDMVNSRANF